MGNSDVKIQCLFDAMTPVGDLKAHPKNRNKHPDDQIKRLADILKYQGWRYPVKVSKRYTIDRAVQRKHKMGFAELLNAS